MPWTVAEPPAVAQNWTESEIERCVAAANAALEDTGDDEQAIFACIRAAGRSTEAESMIKPESKQVRVAATLKTDGENAGSVSAVFSTFDVVDNDRDVVLASAFTDGQQVPMAWAHDWTRPVGKGVIHVTPKNARFDGSFFMESQAGGEAYRITKAMGDLQDWSWGFRVVDAGFEERDGQSVRVIKKADVFEVSPVLRGAGVGTYTQSIKQATPEGMTYKAEAEAALAAVASLVARTEALAAKRAEDGRQLSAEHMARLATLKDDLERLLGLSAEPMPAVDWADLERRFALHARRVRALDIGG